MKLYYEKKTIFDYLLNALIEAKVPQNAFQIEKRLIKLGWTPPVYKEQRFIKLQKYFKGIFEKKFINLILIKSTLKYDYVLSFEFKNNILNLSIF